MRFQAQILISTCTLIFFQYSKCTSNHNSYSSNIKWSKSSLNTKNVSGGFATSKAWRGWSRGGSIGSQENAIATNSNKIIDASAGRVRSRLSQSKIKNNAQKVDSSEIESSSNNEKVRKTHDGPPLKVLFLSSDTGGGHRASAESLAKQFERHYPGSTYDLVDVWTKDGCLPYRTLVPTYKHLSAHPQQWRLLYHFSNTSPYLFMTDTHSMLTCERKIRKTIASYSPDVVVSVHPTMQNVPLKSARKISKKLGKRIPFVTVVTDFGSGHCHWFHKGVDKLYVASDRIRKIAKRRASVKDDKIVQIGLPIRVDFAIQAEAMGDRTSNKGRQYQSKIRNQLGISTKKKMILVMGGGEGVGSLSSIVDALYATLSKANVDATIVVVCGRNQKLKEELKVKDWKKMAENYGTPRRKKRYFLFRLFGRALPSRRIRQSLKNYDQMKKDPNDQQGNVDVIGLGFISNMAEYMVASDVLVTKAGPGTIAEAAAVGLPVMLTSYLPGQEAGNVDIVLDGGFGDYCDDPNGIAEEVACWLLDEPLMDIMSKAATVVGAPNAASDIVLDIGKLTEEWMKTQG